MAVSGPSCDSTMTDVSDQLRVCFERQQALRHLDRHDPPLSLLPEVFSPRVAGFCGPTGRCAAELAGARVLSLVGRHARGLPRQFFRLLHVRQPDLDHDHAKVVPEAGAQLEPEPGVDP